jgi:hypothetical protein
METLGLTPSPKADSIWRNLFWPTIRSEVDVDQIGRQGFWLCFIIASFTLVVTMIAGLYSGGIAAAVFYWLGGIGVRQRSRLAAVVIFGAYLLSVIAVLKYTGLGSLLDIVRFIFLALLFANVRGTFLSAEWRADATRLGVLLHNQNTAPEPSPVRLTATLADRLADQLPMYVWPVGQWFFYVLALLEIWVALVLLFWPELLFFRIA